MAQINIPVDTTLSAPQHRPGHFYGMIAAQSEAPGKTDASKTIVTLTIKPDPSFGLPPDMVAKSFIPTDSHPRWLRVAMAVLRVPLEQARQQMGNFDTAALVGRPVYYSVTVTPKKEGEKYDQTDISLLTAEEIDKAKNEGKYPQQGGVPNGGGGIPNGGGQQFQGGGQQFQGGAPGGQQFQGAPGQQFQQPFNQGAPGGQQFQGGAPFQNQGNPFPAQGQFPG